MAIVINPSLPAAEQPFGSLVITGKRVILSPAEPSSNTPSATDCEILIINDDLLDIRV